MTLSANARAGVSQRQGIDLGVGLVCAALAFVGVLTSTLVAVLPAFKFESQFPAIMPVFLWVAAAGLSHATNAVRAVLDPWRAGFGLVSLVPWVAVLVTDAVAPHVDVPWWVALVSATAAALPFGVASLRGGSHVLLGAERTVTDESLRGTFLIALAIMMMVWALGGRGVIGTIVGVLLVVALGVVALLPHGLAHATRAWRLAHWVALAWGSAIVWLAAPLSATTRFFADPWYLVSTMLIAGLPLVLVNRADARVRGA